MQPSNNTEQNRLKPQKITSVKSDVRYYNADGTHCSINMCLEKFDSVIGIEKKARNGEVYHQYFHVCNECNRKHETSRNKSDTSNSRREAELKGKT